MDIFYSTKQPNGLTALSEYWLQKSEITLNSDRTGILDSVQNLDIIEYFPGIINQFKKSTDDPMNGNKDDLIFYFNFIMDNTAHSYSRTHYTLIDLLKEQGGLIKQVALIAIVLMKPFTFKRHDLQIFEDHVKTHKKKHHEQNIKKDLGRFQNSCLFPTEFYVFCYDIK